MTNGEITSIRPQKTGEPYERFNWDSPILVNIMTPKDCILEHKGVEIKQG